MAEYIDRNKLIKHLKTNRMFDYYSELLYRLIDLIKSEKTVDITKSAEWVSIKDRLPDKSGSYLVIGKSGGAYVTHFYEKSEHYEAHFSSRYVTYWQERPKLIGSNGRFEKGG